MIVPSNDQPSKQDTDQKQALQGDPNEPPPPSYSPHADSGSTFSTGASPSPTFKTKPTNFLALSTSNNAIRGEFVIDPSMSIPSSMLPPLNCGETEGDRKNLSLTCDHSSVHAEIWLLPGKSDTKPSTSAPKPRRTTIALTSDHGAIHAQLRTLDGAAPFLWTSRTVHGSVHLALPRSFQGLLSLSTRHGTISLSDALIRNAMQLSQSAGDTQGYFIGDMNALWEGDWEGNRVEVETTHGSVKVKYLDEEEKTRGLLDRLFGK